MKAQRSSWSGSTSFAHLRTALDGSLKAIGDLGAEAESLNAMGKYSPQGLSDEVREIAQREAIPVLRRAVHAIDAVQSAVQARRDALSLPKVDPGDIAGAVLRAEMR